jgi:hypothetical protein
MNDKKTLKRTKSYPIINKNIKVEEDSKLKQHMDLLITDNKNIIKLSKEMKYLYK